MIARNCPCLAGMGNERIVRSDTCNPVLTRLRTKPDAPSLSMPNSSLSLTLAFFVFDLGHMAHTGNHFLLEFFFTSMFHMWHPETECPLSFAANAPDSFGETPMLRFNYHKAVSCPL